MGSSDSTAGRLIVVRVKAGDVGVEKVIEASQRPEDYGIAMKAYLRWFQQDYEKHADEVRRQRDRFLPQYERLVRDHGAHPRTARSIATLATGFMSFAYFAVDTGAITEDEYTSMRVTADTALLAVAQAQGSLRENATPVEKYMSTLRSLLLQKAVTLSERNTDLDEGVGIGWHDAAFVYLDPDLAWQAVEKFHAQSTSRWPYSKVQMHQSLIDAGVVHRGEPGKATTKRSLGSRAGEPAGAPRPPAAPCGLDSRQGGLRRLLEGGGGRRGQP